MIKNPAIAQIKRLELEEAEVGDTEYDEEGLGGYPNTMHQRTNETGVRRKRNTSRRTLHNLTAADIEEMKRDERMSAFLDKHFPKFVVLALLLCCIPFIFGFYDLIYGIEYEPSTQKDACTRTYTLPPNDVCTEVDLVYTWVNGSDPKLHSDYIKYSKERTYINHDNYDDNEDIDDEEGPLLREMPTLKYSIRAADTYAPWIRRIWIVTNGQVPTWLNISNPRVRIVTHAEIFPNASNLPTFNSNAIEANLHRIPGLAPCWFYQNDDFGFGRPVCLSDFLDIESGRQRLAFDTFYAPDYRAMQKNTWHKSVGFSNVLLNKHYYADTTFVHGHFYEGHNTRLFRTDVLETMSQRWGLYYANTSSHRFRDPYDIALPFLYNNVVLTEFSGIKDRDLFASFLYEKFTPSQKRAQEIVNKIQSEKPLSWCINDGAGRSSGDSKRESIAQAMKALEEELEKWLPTPSDLELRVDGAEMKDTIPVNKAQEKEMKRKMDGKNNNDGDVDKTESRKKFWGMLYTIFICFWAVGLVVYSYRVYGVCKTIFNDSAKIRTI